MLTAEQQDAIAELATTDRPQTRVFPGYALFPDIVTDTMLVTRDFIVGMLDVDSLTSKARADQITRLMNETFDGNYAVSANWYTYDQLALRKWGFMLADVYPAQVIMSAPVDPGNASLYHQLSLLWTSELTALLTAAGAKLPDPANRASLIYTAATLKQDREFTMAAIRALLLARDYHAVGRPDYTYRTEEVYDPVFGFIPPEPALPYASPGGLIADLSDDPALRLKPGEKPHPGMKERTISEIQKLRKVWLTRDRIVLTKPQATQLATVMHEELTGLPVPEVRPGDPGKEAPPASVSATDGSFVPWSEITAVPGVPWISEEIIHDFAAFLAGGQIAAKLSNYWVNPGVLRDDDTGKWLVRYSQPHHWTPVNYARMESTFGLPDYNALRILEVLLNLRQPKLGTEEKTLAVMEKADYITEVFQKWLWSDPERRRTVEEEYNSLFRQFKTGMPDGSQLEFPGKSGDIELYPFQLDAVQKILDRKNTLLAFDTGSGKTYIMIAAAMKLRQSGASTKNMFVVPNNIVGQWEQMFLRMYPDAKLLVVDPARFRPQVRGRVLKEMQKGDYDGIIIAYSCLEQIPLSKQWYKRRLTADIESLREACELYPYRGKWAGFRTILENQIKALKTQAARQITASEKKRIAGAPTFDKLGITGIFLDEAHNYKNVPVHTSLGTIGGVNTAGSAKCQTMLDKVRCVQKSPKGRGAVLATATPLSNSLADAFVMQQYVQPDELENAGLNTFDDWVKSFAKPEFVCEIDVDTSRFRYTKRLARFFNIPELSRMFSSSAAFHTMDAEGIPELEGYTNVLIDRGPELRKFMNELCKRTEAIRAGKVPRTVDNMLKVSTEGRLGALDLRLLGKKQPYGEHSKIRACVDSVMRVYDSSPDATQIIFCDYSTPKNGAFNVYDDLARHLMKRGVPKEEIAFIHSYGSEAKKLELYRRVNSGEVRILIGSTFKLGIGTNVQTKLKALHHLDIPWRPADMVQREGRILRKGNTNSTVKIYRYISEGSFDAYSWQILERKQRFISQFLQGTVTERSATDLDDTVLTYAQVKALAISEPLMRDLAEKENQLRRMQLLASNYVVTSSERRDEMQKLDEQLKKAQKYARATQENAEYLRRIPEEQFKTAYQKLKGAFTAGAVRGETRLPEEARNVLGFEIYPPPAEMRSTKRPFLFAKRNDAEYRVFMGDKPAGNIRRLLNFFQKFEGESKKADENASHLAARIQGNEAALSEANPYPAQIAELKEQISALRAQIIDRQTKASASV